MTGHARASTLLKKAAGVTSALLLTIPFVGAQAPEPADPTRYIDVKLSRYAFSPERIEVRLGEHVWLNVVSVDGAHGFQVKELGTERAHPCSRENGEGRADAEGGRHVPDHLLRVLRQWSQPHEGLVDRDAGHVNAD